MSSIASKGHQPRQVRGPIETYWQRRIVLWPKRVTSRAKCAALLKRPHDQQVDPPAAEVTSRAKCAALLKRYGRLVPVKMDRRRHQPRQVRGPIETTAMGPTACRPSRGSPAAPSARPY